MVTKFLWVAVVRHHSYRPTRRSGLTASISHMISCRVCTCPGQRWHSLINFYQLSLKFKKDVSFWEKDELITFHSKNYKRLHFIKQLVYLSNTLQPSCLNWLRLMTQVVLCDPTWSQTVRGLQLLNRLSEPGQRRWTHSARQDLVNPVDYSTSSVVESIQSLWRLVQVDTPETTVSPIHHWQCWWRTDKLVALLFLNCWSDSSNNQTNLLFSLTEVALSITIVSDAALSSIRCLCCTSITAAVIVLLVTYSISPIHHTLFVY